MDLDAHLGPSHASFVSKSLSMKIMTNTQTTAAPRQKNALLAEKMFA